MVEPGIGPSATPGLQGKQFIHYTMAAPIKISTKPLDDVSPNDGKFSKILNTFLFMFPNKILVISA